MAFEPEGTGSQDWTTGGAIGGSETGFEEEGRMHEAREKTREFMHDARERTSEVVSRAGDRARSRLDSQKSRAARSLRAVAAALRDSGEQLRQKDEGAVAPVVESVADGVDRLSNFLNSRNVDDMMHDVQSFARRRPELFLGAFFTLGVLAARFLKSGQRESGTDRYGYSYVHGTEGARMPDVGETGRGAGMGYEQSRGYSQGSPFSEAGIESSFSQRRGYSAESGRRGEGYGERELPRETERQRGSSERESERFER